MDTLRDNFIKKIENLLLQAKDWQDLPEDTEISIEANVKIPSEASNRIALESVQLGQLRKHLPHDANTANFGTFGELVLSNNNAKSPSSLKILSQRPQHTDKTLDSDLSTPESNPTQSKLTPPRTPTDDTSIPTTLKQTRQPSTDGTTFPKRRKTEQPPRLEQSTIDKLIEGIWEQIHNSDGIALGQEFSDALQSILKTTTHEANKSHSQIHDFRAVTRHCQQVTTSSRTMRAFEVVVQAHWMDCYNARLKTLEETRPDLRSYEHRKMVLTEACNAFSWSDKELRNRMGIWKGYREIKDAAGWVALVFAGPGIYRFCKYRMGFDQASITKLKDLKVRAELAADTLQPQWRNMLALVGQDIQVHWKGHHLDWSVGRRKDKDPLPLAYTYRQWDPDFSFQHLQESIVDRDAWGAKDPRRCDEGPEYFCKSCGKRQSLHAEENECDCFPSLYGPNSRSPCPVQIYQTDNGRNNGLLACCSFEQGVVVGEFLGLITKGLADVDVMQSQVGDNEPFQIWQGRYGNHTRFINHSCQPNCQFETFTWLGIQRIIVVSSGVAAGEEITVDYSSRYWDNLEKICLCGEVCCRYRNKR